MTMTEETTQVLIVGAGGAGLAMSALLARQGIGSILVERRRDISVYPRARNLNFRTLEILRGLGLGPAVHEVAEQMTQTVYRSALSAREERPALDPTPLFDRIAETSPEPFGQYCPQSRLEPLLLAASRDRGGDVRYGAELTDLEQDEHGVRATVVDHATGTSRRIRAGYLVAADGAHSPVRERLGIGADGLGPLPEYFVFIYFRGDWRRFVPGKADGSAVVVRNPSVDGIVLLDEADLGMFVTGYRPEAGEAVEDFTTERCRRLVVAAIGAELDVEIVDHAAWQPVELVARVFRAGRCFLVGDAAHTMPAYKGLGVNTAIQSAHNLAWKLALVINGRAGPALLDTYEAERRPVGRFAAHQSLTGPSAGLLRQNAKQITLPAGEDLPLFYPIVGYRYRSAAVADGSAGDAAGDAAVASEATGDIRLLSGQTLTGRPGERVPHVWFTHDGRRVSTLDVCADRFTVITGPAGQKWHAAAGAVSTELGVPVAAVSIDADQGSPAPDASWPAVTGLPDDGALLVRPDGFVGWRADEVPPIPEHALREAMRAILGTRR